MNDSQASPPARSRLQAWATATYRRTVFRSTRASRATERTPHLAATAAALP